MSSRGFYRGRGRGGRVLPSRSVPRPSTENNSNDQERSRQLDRFFYKTLEGTGQLQKASDAQRLIEAIGNRTDMSECIERLAASQNGQKALHSALTLDTSSSFINRWSTQLLEALSDPALKRVCNGELLNQVLWVMVEPPIFWNAILEHARSGNIDVKATEVFAWLLLQMVILPVAQSGPFRETAKSLLTNEFLETSPSPVSRGLFEKIKSLVDQISPHSDDISVDDHGPGGRHDNDFVNYHDISILPTRDEIESADPPFIRNGSAMMAAEPVDRAYIQLDNQFRLLREDMLEEMRDDLKFAKNNRKKGSRRSMLLERLILVDIDKDALRTERPCGLLFQCSYDVLNMPGATVEQRKKQLKSTPAFLKHQSFGCIMVNKTPVAFATLNRKEDQLALLEPCICLLVPNGHLLQQILLALRQGPIDFLGVPTPLFAYEPILERLQRKVEIELDRDLLGHSSTPPPSPFTPVSIVEAIERSDNETDFKELLGTAKQVKLDNSQIKALSMALTHQVVEIQGPPGKLEHPS